MSKKGLRIYLSKIEFSHTVYCRCLSEHNVNLMDVLQPKTNIRIIFGIILTAVVTWLTQHVTMSPKVKLVRSKPGKQVQIQANCWRLKSFSHVSKEKSLSLCFLSSSFVPSCTVIVRAFMLQLAPTKASKVAKGFPPCDRCSVDKRSD